MEVSDEIIRLWEVESRQHKATLEDYEEQVHSVVFAPDGKTLASISSGDISSSTTERTIRLWDVESRQHKATSKDIWIELLLWHFRPMAKPWPVVRVGMTTGFCYGM